MARWNQQGGWQPPSSQLEPCLHHPFEPKAGAPLTPLTCKTANWSSALVLPECKCKEASISSKCWKPLSAFAHPSGNCHNSYCWTFTARSFCRSLLLPIPFHSIQMKLLPTMSLKLLSHVRLLSPAFLSNQGQRRWPQGKAQRNEMYKNKAACWINKKGKKKVAKEAEKHK